MNSDHFLCFGYALVGPREDKVVVGVTVSTIQSTDAGVAFLVKADGVTRFHAGDDANKDMDLTGSYSPQIDYLASKGEGIDFAFMPVRGLHGGCSAPMPEKNRLRSHYPNLYSEHEFAFETRVLFFSIRNTGVGNGSQRSSARGAQAPR